MKFRSGIFRNRFFRIAGLAVLVAFLWLVWWLWPPQPECTHRVAGAMGIRDISPNGKSFVRVTDSDDPDPDGAITFIGNKRIVEKLTDVELIDLHTRQTCLKLHNVKSRFQFSPDGSRLAYQDHEGCWHCVTNSTRDTSASFPKKAKGDGTWSSDSRHFAITDDKVQFVCNADSGDVVMETPPSSYRRCFFIPDGSGFIVPSHDRGHVEVWKFNPIRKLDSLSLPGTPYAGDWWDGPAPAANSTSILSMASNLDGTAVCSRIIRFEPHDGGFAIMCYLICWDRVFNRRTEIADGQYEPARTGGINLSQDRRFISHACDGFICASFHYPDWLKWRMESDGIAANFWDISKDPPLCCNSPELPAETRTFFEATGRQFIATEAGKSLSIFALPSLSRIARFDYEDLSDVQIDPTQRWISASVRPISRDLLPTWVPTFVQDWLSAVDQAICLINIRDCRVSRLLPSRRMATFCTDGSVWTRTLPKDMNVPGAEIIFERWCPEGPPPPWWLWLITLAGIARLLKLLSIAQFIKAACVR